MPQTREELLLDAFAALANLKTSGEGLKLYPLLYTPDQKLGPLLKEIAGALQRKALKTLTVSERQQLGYTLEKVALLAFQGLAGITSVKSYQSAGPQHDLLVRGVEMGWQILCTSLGLKESGGILIEAKATKGKVGDKEMQRLGNILTHHLGKSCRLGVFFTLEGATGFPERGKHRTPSLRQARLAQTIIYYSAGKPVVVFDWEDIKALGQPGSLVMILERKIREIEEMTGAPTQLATEPVEVLLPAHLSGLCTIKPPPP